MKATTSRALREELPRSHYQIRRTFPKEESWEPSPRRAKETERVIWLFIVVLFSLILFFGYLFWHKI